MLLSPILTNIFGGHLRTVEMMKSQKKNVGKPQRRPFDRRTISNIMNIFYHIFDYEF